MSNISMARMIRAVEFYSKLGYTLVDAPQCVDLDVSQHTKPAGVPETFHRGIKVYVGSAEQSFLQMRRDGELTAGRYMAVTPCVRHEPVLDSTHYQVFLKLELISVGLSEDRLLCSHAKEFFNSEGVLTEEVITDIGVDLESGGIELGSYGTRTMLDGTQYTYGTGLAEPRMSVVVNGKA